MRDVTWDDLTITGRDVLRSYEDWSWLLNDQPILPLMITKFGDLFYQTSNGEVHFLDTMEGTDSCVCRSKDQFMEFINQKENIEHYLLSDLVHVLINQGKVTAPHECYMFKVLPVLGGETTADNVEIMSAVVGISITGQVHKQLKELPEGTRIDKFVFSDED